MLRLSMVGVIVRSHNQYLIWIRLVNAF